MKFIRQNLLPYITFIYDGKKTRCDTNSKLANRPLKMQSWKRRNQRLKGKKKNKIVQCNYRCTVGLNIGLQQYWRKAVLPSGIIGYRFMAHPNKENCASPHPNTQGLTRRKGSIYFFLVIISSSFCILLHLLLFKILNTLQESFTKPEIWKKEY